MEYTCNKCKTTFKFTQKDIKKRKYYVKGDILTLRYTEKVETIKKGGLFQPPYIKYEQIYKNAIYKAYKNGYSKEIKCPICFFTNILTRDRKPIEFTYLNRDYKICLRILESNGWDKIK